MYQFLNPNPISNQVGDCVIRAISIATNQSWDETYTGVVLKGFELKDMPSSNMVWDAYLRDHGFTRNIIPNTCPHCYTVRQFGDDHPEGVYILATGSHVVTVQDGDYYDSWDSGSEVPIYYYVKEEN